MCEMPYLRHKFYDFDGPIVSTGVYLLFARPFGRAKWQYCERCGSVRLVALNEPDSEAKEKLKGKCR